MAGKQRYDPLILKKFRGAVQFILKTIPGSMSSLIFPEPSKAATCGDFPVINAIS